MISKGRIRPGQGSTTFADLSEFLRRGAAESEVCATLENAVYERIVDAGRMRILSADTSIAERYRSPVKCFHWLTDSHREWLLRNQTFAMESGQQIYSRLIFVPFPLVAENWHERQVLIEAILLHVHLSLVHGVVAGVVFIDPAEPSELMKALPDLNFFAITSHKVFFDNPGFYQAVDRIHAERAAMVDFGRRIAHVANLVHGNGFDPIWLYYDEETYSGRRLKGWRWEMYRRFFQCLYGPTLVCYGCREELGRSFALDHVAPVARGYPQTILNFHILCKQCNSQKGASIGHDPFGSRVILPSTSRTADLEHLCRNRPAWVGNVSAPISKRDIASNAFPNC